MSASMPKKYTASKCMLHYTTEQTEETVNLLSSDAWSMLEPGHSYGKAANVGPVVFDGSVTITQKGKGCRCTLTWTPQHYTMWSAEAGPKKADPIWVQLKPGKERSINLSGDEVAARELPLAKCHESFKYFKLTMSYKDMDREDGQMAKNEKGVCDHLKYLLTGRPGLDPQDTLRRILRGDSVALENESKARHEQLGLFEGVTIRTYPGKARRSVLVEVFPPRPKKDDRASEAQNFDFNKKLGQSYLLKAPKLFPVVIDKEGGGMKEYPIFGAPPAAGWELIIVKGQGYSSAAFVGFIRNSFGGQSIDAFLGEEHDVSLEPIVNDILGFRSRIAVSSFGTQVDEYRQQLMGLFPAEKEAKARSLLPAEALFSHEACAEDENNSPDTLDVPHELSSWLNGSQLDAVIMALARRISVIYGPPGTGKSIVLTSVLRVLVTMTKEKVIAVAVTNVAVNALLASCVKLCQKLNDYAIPPFVRVYSESQIFSQWQNEEYDVLEDQYHIDARRYEEALRDPNEHAAYLAGRQSLHDNGVILSKEQYTSYTNNVKRLNDIVLEKAQVVFCTITACRSSALIDDNPLEAKAKACFEPSTIVIDEAGNALRPHVMITVMTFRTAKRLVLAGDPRQLAALILSQDASNWWHPSFLDLILEKKWPHTFLDVQYRMHSVLYAHLSAVVYKRQITSARNTSEPSPELQRLQGALPLRFHIVKGAYSVGSYMNFLDVPDGVKRTLNGGSSYNEAEVEVVSGLVEALLQAGIPGDTIAVMTGYTEQRRLIKLEAKRRGWESQVKKIMTIEASQGSEFDISIVSLVNTFGTAGFMRKRSRSCVGTSRHKEAIYLIGHASYWLYRREYSGFKVMQEILFHMRDSPDLPVPFVVRRQPL